MIRQGIEIWREKGASTLYERAIDVLSRKARRFVEANIEPPASVLYRWFELRAAVGSTTSDANPMDPIWVDPDRIRYYHSGGPKRFGQVAGGNWDTASERFEENIVARSIISRFTRNLNWSETPLYRKYRTRMRENGGSYYGRKFDGKRELDRYFKDIDRLYESISKDGYLMQRKLLESGKTVRDESNDSYHPYLNEVTVNVYRDGELAKRKSGNHRLAIAKIHPEVDEIPVLVRVRHREWQDIRDEIRRADASTQLSSRARAHLDHPDLVDIVPEMWIE